MTFTAIVCTAIFVCVLLAAGATVRTSRRRHQHRNAMRKHKVKVIVDDHVSVDIALICPCPPKVTAEIALTFGTFKVQGDIRMFSYTTNQRVIGEIIPKDDMGDPAGWENMNITSTDPALGEIQALDEEPDNKLKFQVISPIASQVDWSENSNPRPFTVNVDFDGRVGDGVNPVHIEINGELTRRDATGGSVNFSAAQDYAPSGERAAGGEGGESNEAK